MQCRVLGVNRSTYYKHFSNKVSDKYGIKISARRVYRLMKSMDLPQIAETKPKYRPHK